METRRAGWFPPRRVPLGRFEWLVVVIVIVVVAGVGGWTIHARRTTIDRGLGRPVADFTLLDVSGRPVSLRDYRDKSAVVLAFMGTECPVGNLYMPRLVALAEAYRDRGVEFLIINAGAHEPAEEVAEHAATYHVDFPVLKDVGNVVADKLGVERTCETLVLDGRGRLCYRGAIDDQYVQGRRKTAPTRNSLAEAIEDVLAGRACVVQSTTVVGCPIDRLDPLAAVGNRPRVRPAPFAILSALKERETHVSVGRVTYAEDVAPILEAKCQSCHRPGQVGPFSLLNYKQARRWAASIREVVEDRRMPPWHADPRHGRFSNDRSLTARERATLLAWVEQGTAPGDTRAVLPPKTFPEEWTVGTPDLVLRMLDPFPVPAQGVVSYKRFRVPTGFTEDRWVQAAEARPGDRAVVHHIGVYLDDHDPKSKPVEPHLKHVLAIYFPGEVSSVFSHGIARRIPAGSDLIFEVHYTPIGVTRSDTSMVGITFARGPVAHEAHTKGIPNKQLRIPPGVANHPARSSYTFPSDVHLLTLMPHMHLRGKDFLYTAVYPDGRSEVLLSVPSYDFGWQSIYRLAEPKAMPRGTRIDCLAHFDNSAANPVNPNPATEVVWGNQSWEEMMIGYIDYYEDARPTPHPAAIETSRLRKDLRR